MILEGIVTTLNADGSVNIAPMGPQVDLDLRQMVLRPFQTSTTFQNLKRSGQGVFHVTDDVELLARAAIGQLDPLPELTAAEGVEGFRLADTCRWHAFQVRHCDEQARRASFIADVVVSGRVRDFFGFNRAKHAILEAAILATRTQLLPSEEIAAEFARLKVLVEKTGGPQEHRAFAVLGDYVAEAGKRGGNG